MDKTLEIKAKLQFINSLSKANRLYQGKIIDKPLLRALCLMSGYRIDLSTYSEDCLAISDNMRFRALLRTIGNLYSKSAYKLPHKTLKQFIRFMRLITTYEIQSELQAIEAGKYARNKKPIVTFASIIGE
jgi:hypothetical protein